MANNEIQFLLYSLPDEEGKVQVVIKDETIWCTQKAMAQLFGIDKSGISRHIANNMSFVTDDAGTVHLIKTKDCTSVTTE